MKSVLILMLGAMFANITASDYADSAEQILKANRDNYLAGAHTLDRQQAALLYFDQEWAWFKSSQACGSKLLGSAGTACIADRSRSGKWPWEIYYRDPIVTGHL